MHVNEFRLVVVVEKLKPRVSDMSKSIRTQLDSLGTIEVIASVESEINRFLTDEETERLLSTSVNDLISFLKTV